MHQTNEELFAEIMDNLFKAERKVHCLSTILDLLDRAGGSVLEPDHKDICAGLSEILADVSSEVSSSRNLVDVLSRLVLNGKPSAPSPRPLS